MAQEPLARVTVLVARRDQLMHLETTFGAEPRDQWRIEPDPNASPEQAARRGAWLDGDRRP